MKEHRYPEEVKEDAMERVYRLFEVERKYDGEETDESGESSEGVDEAE